MTYFIEAKYWPHAFADDHRLLESVARHMTIKWKDIRTLGFPFTSTFDIEKDDGSIALSGAVTPKGISMSVSDGPLFAKFALLIARLMPQECALALYEESLGCPIIDLTPTTSWNAILVNFGFAHP